jgi:uncharacterized membrane protein
MNRLFPAVSRTASLLLAVAWLCSGSSAHAFDRTVNFCNHTRGVVKVAATYDETGSSQSTSRGWVTVPSCQCRVAISASLKATEVFLFAVKSGTIAPLLQGTGRACVHPTQRFRFVSQNSSAAACRAAGGQWVAFKQFDTGASSEFTETLREPNACNV